MFVKLLKNFVTIHIFFGSYEEAVVDEGLLGEVIFAEVGAELPEELLNDVDDEHGHEARAGHAVKQTEHQAVQDDQLVVKAAVHRRGERRPR